MHHVILFDLGNVLFYRDKSHIDWDLELIKRTTRKKKEGIRRSLDRFVEDFPGIYDYRFDNAMCQDIDKEDRYNAAFFNRVFQFLGVSNETLKRYLHYRKSQMRYKPFPRTRYYLRRLERQYQLGVMTNGRPSRRRVLRQLNIYQYFDDDKIFISDELGFKKPDPQIFQHVSRCLPKTDLILCDDEEVNLTMARSFGWQAIFIDHKKEGFKPLEEIGDRANG